MNSYCFCELLWTLCNFWHVLLHQAARGVPFAARTEDWRFLQIFGPTVLLHGVIHRVVLRFTGQV